MATNNILRCRFCNYTTLLWYYSKGKAKPVNGFNRLCENVYAKHAGELPDINDLPDEEVIESYNKQY